MTASSRGRRPGHAAALRARHRKSPPESHRARRQRPLRYGLEVRQRFRPPREPGPAPHPREVFAGHGPGRRHPEELRNRMRVVESNSPCFFGDVLEAAARQTPYVFDTKRAIASSCEKAVRFRHRLAHRLPSAVVGEAAVNEENRLTIAPLRCTETGRRQPRCGSRPRPRPWRPAGTRIASIARKGRCSQCTLLRGRRSIGETNDTSLLRVAQPERFGPARSCSRPCDPGSSGLQDPGSLRAPARGKDAPEMSLAGAVPAGLKGDALVLPEARTVWVGAAPIRQASRRAASHASMARLTGRPQ